MGGGPAHGAYVSAEVVRSVAEVDNGAEVAAGGGVFLELGGGAVQTASVGAITELGLVAGEGVVRRCGPEAYRGKLALPVVPAVERRPGFLRFGLFAALTVPMGNLGEAA